MNLKVNLNEISVSQLYVHNQVGNSSDGKMPVHLDITVYGTKCDSIKKIISH